jgi:hypothetical protein
MFTVRSLWLSVISERPPIDGWPRDKVRLPENAAGPRQYFRASGETFFGVLCTAEYELIPRSVDKGPFDRFPLSAGQAWFAPWRRAPKAGHNAASGQGKPASGGTSRTAGCVAALARCGRIALRTAPARAGREVPSNESLLTLLGISIEQNGD